MEDRLKSKDTHTHTHTHTHTEETLTSYKALLHKNGRYVIKWRRKYETAFGFKTEPNLRR
jgi:hypothetical protein